MSDYEIIMLLLQVMTVIIAFGGVNSAYLPYKKQIALRYRLVAR